MTNEKKAAGKNAGGKGTGKGSGLIQAVPQCGDEEQAEAWLRARRWPAGIRCPGCDGAAISARTSRRQTPQYHCKGCKGNFTVKTGTIMHDSKLPLGKWVLAFQRHATDLKGVSGLQLRRDLDITQKSAWRLARRIRATWNEETEQMAGPVEADERYSGSREFKKRESKKRDAGRGRVGKTAGGGGKDREAPRVSAAAAARGAGAVRLPRGGADIPEIAAAEQRVICADNRSFLPSLAAESVDLVVTSPPYFGQRAYSRPGLGNEGTIEEYLDNVMETFAQVLRVMKPTGSIVYNLGDKVAEGSLQLIPYRFALRVLERFELRLVNDITWLKRNPTPHQFPRRLTGSTEPFFHFAMGSDYYYDRPAFQPREPKPWAQPTARLGNRYRDLIESAALNAAERRAAHRALDDVIADVWAGRLHGFRMKLRGIHAPAYGGQEGGRKLHLERHGFTIIRMTGNTLKRDVIENRVESLPGNGHPTVFPVRVVRELVRLLCPPEGRVLDPYLGSGSTMVAAAIEGRSCTGIEISAEYCQSARERVARTLTQAETRSGEEDRR